MNKVGQFILATMLLGVSLLFATPLIAATDGVYTLTETTASWDGTSADRLKAKTTNYDYSYGDEASITYALPWSFPFYGQTYNQITADTNGNIWFTASGSAHSINLANTGRGPVISAWNNDLSSYYYGGVYVQRKTSPERVVVQWQTETYSDEGFYRPNNFEVVLFPNGAVRLDYSSSAAANQKDFGSGISRGDGSESLSLTANVAPAPTLSGRSFLYTVDAISVTASANPVSPQMVGTPITITANGIGSSGNYEYRFWLNSGSGYNIVQEYGAANTWVWTPVTTGAYDVLVDVRNAGSTAFREAFTKLFYYQIISPPASGVTVTPDLPSPQTINSSITFTATGQGGSGSYEYRFWLNSGSGYEIVQDYSASSIWAWTPAAVGAYDILVDVRNAGSTAFREAFTKLFYYQITSP